MQDFVLLAAILRDVSIGILIVGLFYTFGMFMLGRLFSVIGEHGETDHDMEHGDIDHDVEKDWDHDVSHDIEHDIDHEYDVEHDVDHDYDVDHDIDHDVEKDWDHSVEHDVEKDWDHDIDHDVEKDWDHDVEHDAEKDYDHGDHELDLDHDIETEKSGFFETERGAPMGVTIGTFLVSFGFLGAILYYEGIMFPVFGKILFHFVGVGFTVYGVRTLLGKVFVESGFMIEPRHLVGKEVEAVSTITDDFGEVRAETEMGLRRFHARPFEKKVVFQKEMKLFVISADEKFVYVDPRKDVLRGQQHQSRRVRSE